MGGGKVVLQTLALGNTLRYINEFKNKAVQNRKSPAYLAVFMLKSRREREEKREKIKLLI